MNKIWAELRIWLILALAGKDITVILNGYFQEPKFKFQQNHVISRNIFKGPRWCLRLMDQTPEEFLEGKEPVEQSGWSIGSRFQ